jgi:tetratricopeptide (TPR) repeat protein
MPRSSSAPARAFVAGLSRLPLLALALTGAMELCVAGAAHAADKDYATCFSENKVSADQQIAVCSPIAEDSTEIADVRVNAYFARGLAYAQKNDIDHVIVDMTDVVAIDPTYVPAFTNRAIAWETKGNFDQAIADYTHTIALTPDDANLYIYRARALSKNGQPDRAIADCDKAIEIDPANEIAYGVRAIAWENKGDPARAGADFEKAESVGMDPIAPYHDRALSWIAKGERKRAEADCKHIADIDTDKGRDCAHRIAEAFGRSNDGARNGGSSAAYAQNAKGVEWQDKGDHTRAIAAFDEAIRLNPKSSAFYFNRAKSWGLKQDYNRAIADLDEAIRRNPSNAQAYRLRGMTMAQIGKSKEAFADLDKAVSLNPTDPKPYFIRALAWAASDIDRAIADLDKAITLDPTNSDYRKERLKAQLRKRKTTPKTAHPIDPTASSAYESNGVAEAPTAPQTIKPAESPTYEPLQLYPKKEDHSELVAWNLNRGLEQQNQGNVGGAIDAFSSAIELDPYNADAFYNRAHAEASQGTYAAAAADCRRAIELDLKRAGACNEHGPDEPTQKTSEKTRNPAAAKILIERAEARLAEYSIGGALLDLAKAISLDPDNADAYLIRSHARTLNGDKAGAAMDCRRAIELDRNRSGACDVQLVGDSSASPALPQPHEPATDSPKPQAIVPNVPSTNDLVDKSLAAKAKVAAPQPASQIPNKTVDNAIEQGTIWRAQKQYDRAIEQYGIAIAADPSNAVAYTLRGFTYALKGDPDRAMADQNKAIKLNPKSTDSYYYRSALWMQKGKIDRAIADLTTIISLKPKDAQGLCAAQSGLGFQT